MTPREFMKVLGELPGQGYQIFFGGRSIRLKAPESRRDLCPNTAVCLYRTGTFYPVENFEAAVRDLDLYPRTGRAFANAADLLPKLNKLERGYREKMLAALGL